MRYPKRRQHKYAKPPGAGLGRLRDRAAEARRPYGLALRRRTGSLACSVTGRPGGQPTYSDLAIEAALSIRMIFRLPLRPTDGFLRSLIDLLGLELPIPDQGCGSTSAI